MTYLLRSLLCHQFCRLIISFKILKFPNEKRSKYYNAHTNPTFFDPNLIRFNQICKFIYISPQNFCNLCLEFFPNQRVEFFISVWHLYPYFRNVTHFSDQPKHVLNYKLFSNSSRQMALYLHHFLIQRDVFIQHF